MDTLSTLLTMQQRHNTQPVRVDDAQRTAAAEAADEGERAAAVERVSLYLHSVGLRGESLRRESEALVDAAADKRPAGYGSGLTRAAMDHTMETVERWIDGVIADAQAFHPAASIACRRIFAWRLPELLTLHPEGFLQREGLPPAFRAAVEAAAGQLLPEVVTTAMPQQRIDFLPMMPDTSHASGRVRRALRSFWQAVGS